jgi:hypothetical protein
MVAPADLAVEVVAEAKAALAVNESPPGLG